MQVIGSHPHIGQLIVSIMLFIGTAMASSAASLGREDTWSISKKEMNSPVSLNRMKEKDASFLRALHDHHGIINKICRVYCNNRMEVEDLFQEIIYQLWKAYPGFQNKSAVSTWMYTVALKTAMAPYQKGRIKVEFREDLPEMPVMPDSGSVQVHDEFYHYFHKLIPIDRAIVALMIEGYSRKEIGAVLGLSVKAVTMRAGRLRLRR